jgi:hypothetical protein
MQLYGRLYDYINEYWKLIHDTYAVHAIPFLVTYYHINKQVTVWDKTYMMGGSYEKFGELTGMKWDKYLLLPVFYIEETFTIFDAQEIGYINEGESGLVVPSNYGFIPLANDMVKFDVDYLSNRHPDPSSIFAVTGLQHHPGMDKYKSYWKLKLSIEQTVNMEIIDKQVENTYVFYDYDKKMHTVQESSSMTKMLSKHNTLKGRLKNLYDQNSGFYFV